MHVLTTLVLPFLTLFVLLWGLRIASLTPTRNVMPQVECYLRPYRRRSRLGIVSHGFDLVIANHGLGSAHNVSVTLEVDEDDFKAHGVVLGWRSTEAPFSIIEPGGSVETFFGWGSQLMEGGSALKPFKAVVKYQWQPFWAKKLRSENRSFSLDVRPFKGLGYTLQKDEVAEVLDRGLKEISTAIKTRH